MFQEPTGLPKTAAEKLIKAKQLKEEGNELFKAEQWKPAAKKYHYSLMYARGLLDTFTHGNFLTNLLMTKKEEGCQVTPEQKEDAMKLLVALSNNLAGTSTDY